MIYLYAYTNHKSNLDSLRRVVAIYNDLKKSGIESEILINEYRAQLLLRDWGLPFATTIETIKDIDAVVTKSDIILIDTPEKIEGKVLNYPEKFKKVIYLNSSCRKVSFRKAEVIEIFKENNIIFNKLQKGTRDKKSIYILGDFDYGKIILKNSEIFKNKGLDLYWGIYFFVKYEEKLSEFFENIIESEEYYNILIQYQKIITSSVHVAVEAALNGAYVEFLKLQNITECSENILKKMGIKIVNIINKSDNTELLIENLNYSNDEIINIIKYYM